MSNELEKLLRYQGQTYKFDSDAACVSAAYPMNYAGGKTLYNDINSALYNKQAVTVKLKVYNGEYVDGEPVGEEVILGDVRMVSDWVVATGINAATKTATVLRVKGNGTNELSQHQYYTQTEVGEILATALAEKASINGDTFQDFTAAALEISDQESTRLVELTAAVDTDSNTVLTIADEVGASSITYTFDASDTDSHVIATEDYVTTSLAAKADLNGSSSENFYAQNLYSGVLSVNDGDSEDVRFNVTTTDNVTTLSIYDSYNSQTIKFDFDDTDGGTYYIAVEPTVVSDTSSAAITLNKNIIYDLGTLSRNVVLSLPSSYTAADEFEFRFTAATGYSIDLPSGLKMANETTWEATDGYTYQVIICGGFVYFGYITPSTAATE